MKPPQAPRLQGLRLKLGQLLPTALTLAHLLNLEAEAPEPVATSAPSGSRADRLRYRLQGLQLDLRAHEHSIASAPRPSRVDTLRWHAEGASGISAQRRHLLQLGLQVTEGADFGCGDVLRVEGSDTGACAMEWRGAGAGKQPGDQAPEGADAADRVAIDAPLGNEARAEAAPTDNGLSAIELVVRTPVRVGAHWASLLHAPLLRDHAGVLQLHTQPAALRFVPPQGDATPGDITLVFERERARCIAQRATAMGLPVEPPDAAWSLDGIRVRAARTSDLPILAP